MDKIYLIEKIWIDDMENTNPYGYSPVGFVETLEEAKEIVANGGKHKKEDCWTFGVAFPDQGIPSVYRYKEIEHMGKREKLVKDIREDTDTNSFPPSWGYIFPLSWGNDESRRKRK